MYHQYKLRDKLSSALIFSGDRLYSVKGQNKTIEYNLNAKEMFIMDYLATNSSLSSPSQPRDIESAYRSHYGKELTLYALKNTIASLRKKYKSILAANQIPADENIIVNIFKEGYYISLEKNQDNNPDINRTFDLDNYKPSSVEVFSIAKSALPKSARRQILKLFTLASIILTALYIMQINYINQIVNKYHNDTDWVFKQVLKTGCTNSAIDVLSQSHSLNSAIYVLEHEFCIINKDSIITKPIEDYRKELTTQDKFVYAVRTDDSQQFIFFGRASKKSIDNRYRDSRYPYLVDSIKIENILNDQFRFGGSGEIKVYSYYLDSGTEISYYSNNLLTELLLIFLVLIAACYSKAAFNLVNFSLAWKKITLRQEKVINTNNNSLIYIEILTGIVNENIIKYIRKIANQNLLTLHTVMIIESIYRANLAQKRASFGINICPSILTGNNFNFLLSHLLKLEPNELTLEITENSNINYSSEIIKNILILKELGFKIAIDDFGTGNNNVSLITKISPNYIKIDREFVQDIEFFENKIPLLIQLNNIGKTFDCLIIQEGIENIKQKNILTKIGTNYQQGYLYND